MKIRIIRLVVVSGQVLTPQTHPEMRVSTEIADKLIAENFATLVEPIPEPEPEPAPEPAPEPEPAPALEPKTKPVAKKKKAIARKKAAK